jgi:long-subunit acyl-CoA synthetase (AMP-forming)
MVTDDLQMILEAGTLPVAFRRRVDKHPQQMAVRTVDDEVAYTWGGLRDAVDALAGGLARLGVERGHTVALMLTNRPEFFVADLAVATLGAVPFSIYQTLAPEQIAYVVGDADARVAIVERSFLDAFLAARTDLPNLEHVILIDGDAVPGTIPLAEVAGSNPGFDAAAAAAAVRPDDLMTLIYTSGTTGPPKGVQLSYRNLFSLVEPISTLLQLPDEGRVISWLPTAHIAERALNYYFPLLSGSTITTCPNPRDVISYLPKVRPSFFFAVPRIWEKLKAGLEAQLAAAPEEMRVKMQVALADGIARLHLEQAGTPVPADLARRVEAADAELFSGLRTMLGFDQVVAVGVGAAPTPREVLDFFHALGIKLGEGWGMSETCGLGTINPPGEIRLGTVGRAIPGVELELAADGELLIRGQNIMVGYRNQPEKTRETIADDGWLATGDVAEIDDDGYVRIVDRKKELIINAAGKNMSPSNIESTLKGASPLIGQVCVHGDRRPYNTALIVLDADFAPAWATQHGLAGKSIEALAAEPALIAAVQAGVDAGNTRLARVEQVKKFTILPAEWMPGGDELTPTMKLKRKPIAAKYAAEIDAMY